jgi:eukaryotic-like serine/threonine-protein kinase
VTTLGKYRLIATLGRGGMADVNLAMVDGPMGSGFSKLAVVKRVRSSIADDPEFVAMLVNEARISAQLRHPNVVQTFDVNVHNGKPYLAMEYLDGLPLSKLRKRAKEQHLQIPAEVEYVIVADVLAGLHHAHELSNYDGSPLAIVHRDVTPHNVFITIDGQVKVVDFGIAKAAGQTSVTQQGFIRGKIRYMSPEQACGLELERRSDLFSVGILLWEAATGRRFWEGVDERDIGRILRDAKYEPSPRNVEPNVPPAIDAICRKALARDPNNRYATAEEFRRDIEAFLGDEIVFARKQLNPTISALATKDRAKLRSIIEQAAKESVDASHHHLSAHHHAAWSVPTDDDFVEHHHAPRLVVGGSEPTNGEASTIAQAIAPTPSSAPRRSRLPMIAAITFAVFATVIAVATLGRASLSASASTSPSTSSTQPSPKIAETSAPRTITRESDGAARHHSSSSSTTTSAETSSPSPSTAPAPVATPQNTPPQRWKPWRPAAVNRTPQSSPRTTTTSTSTSTSTSTTDKANKPDLSLDTSDPWSASNKGQSRGQRR